MKKIILIIIFIICILTIGIIFLVKNKDTHNDLEITSNEDLTYENQSEQTSQNEIKEEEDKVENIKIKVNNEVLSVKLEQNSATEALIEKLKQGDVTVNTHEYGSFEQVGSLGFSLPREDTQITTKAGDVMLYQGNQITLFFGSNSWSYTKLGEVVGKSKEELKAILGSENITLVLSID